ncbi:MAG TPA: aromatic ring-opening dioxygenase LigA [Ornithinibacter sp.]|nr:aromatic ring-opening dioxygenase LigA [Ornithinibacter sp.]
MSNTTTQPTAAADTRATRGFVKISGIVIAVIGAIMFLGGAGTWVLVQNSLADERITVSEDADWFANQEVNGPLTAYSEAMVIEKHALEASDNKTYAELDREDPVRVVVMNGSFLRASLFTSVLAFGVSAMAMGLGFVQVLGGLALAKVGRTIDA